MEIEFKHTEQEWQIPDLTKTVTERHSQASKVKKLAFAGYTFKVIERETTRASSAILMLTVHQEGNRRGYTHFRVY